MPPGITIDRTKELGQVLKKRRKDQGITEKDLAKFTNLSHTGIGGIEMVI